MRKFLLILSILSIGIILIIIFNYLEKDESVKLKISMESSVFKEVNFIQKKETQQKFKFYAQEAFMSEDGKILDLNNLTMIFPEKEFEVIAKKGVYYTETGDVYLSKEIEGVSKDYKIYGSEAFWNGKERFLYSEKPIKIVGNKFSIEGNAGIATADFIELKKGVTAIVYFKK